MLLLLAAMVAVGWEGQRRMTIAQGVLERRAMLEAELRTMQAGALQFMLEPKPGALDAVLSRSGQLDQSFSAFKMAVEHDVAVRLDKAMRANIEFRGALERWQSVSDGRATRLQEAENAAGQFLTLFDELAGKKRDAAFLHPDGYASADVVNNRLAELRLVNDVQREFYEARMLSREWMRSGDAKVLEEVRTRMGNVLTLLGDLKGTMTALADKDFADTLLAHGRDYLASLSDLEDSTGLMNDVRSTLASAVADMRDPMKVLADKYEADLDYVHDIGTLTVGGIVALAVFVALIFTLIISSGVRKRLARAQKALDALAAGECPVRDPKDSVEDMGLLTDAMQRLALSSTDMAECVQAMARGEWDVQVPVRSEKDVLGNALRQLAENGLVVRKVLQRGANGDFNQSIPPQSKGDAAVAALDGLQQFVNVKVGTARNATLAVRDAAGRAMEALKSLESRIAEKGARPESSGALSDMLPRLESVNAALKGNAASLKDADKGTDRLAGAVKRLDAEFRTLMGKASFAEDVARQIETLAINVNIEMGRVGDNAGGLAAIVTELKAVVDRCREHSAAMNDSLYAGRRASDDTAALIRDVQEALGHSVQVVVAGAAVLEDEMAALRTMASSRAAHARAGERDDELRAFASLMGKSFSGLVMELNTLRSALDAFRIAGDQGQAVPAQGATGRFLAEDGKGKPRDAQLSQGQRPSVRSMPPLRLGKGKEDFAELEGEDL
ncbi:hypothetical protein N1030_03465 [Desulfovibrio mangrovi]|uniref:hypothetical protein n=1 Tax=Desulfovibrio mangrovi TaxID=2976983 RepID=UPI002246FF56|nr:hypothetical protein [Desulfovibrio mangrovi]UZP68048.1 hypothetical protein N1030_03465 [Desulfovibrio mangrovi]